MLAESYEPATNKVEIVLDRVAQAWPPPLWRDVTTLIAASGGADSTALARALVALQQPGEGRLVILHYNHRLRGEESDADEQFVRQLAAALGLSVDVDASQPLSASERVSEETARDARYRFFKEAASRWGARYVVTAHTADDQVETVLHRIFRGTGIAGLAGIPRIRPLTEMTSLVRPMLEVSRAEVLSYLKQVEQQYRIDSSNLGGAFTRNRLRNELLPWIETNIQSNARESIRRLSNQASEVAAYLRSNACALLELAIISKTANEVVLDHSRLAEADLLLLRSLYIELWQQQGWPEQAMGAAEWQRLADWTLRHPSPPLTLPSGIRAAAEAGKISLTGPGSPHRN